MGTDKFAFGLPFMLSHQNVEEAIVTCLEEGLAFVELNTNFPLSSLETLEGLPLKKMAQDAGIFFTLHLDDLFDPFNFNQKVREAYLESMVCAIKLGIQCGMRIINMHIPRGNIVTLPSGKVYLYQAYQEAFVQAVINFRELCARTIGNAPIKIAIENSELFLPYELSAIEMLLEEACFGLCLDIGHEHAAQNGDMPFYLTHQNRLIHMHAHDGWGQTNHQALGSGEIDLKQRLGLAKAQGASVVLETKTKEALSQSVRWLRENGFM